MTSNKQQIFDICQYTRARRRLVMTVDYEGMSPEQVFETMGDPQQITDWYLLAKTVKIHPKGSNEQASFNVEFVFFGDVYEEILLWDAPSRYVYRAHGDDFPIKDYIGVIEVEESEPKRGTMRWCAYFDDIQGDHYRRILPVILPAINCKSAELLSGLIGGTSYSVSSFFEDFP